MFITNFLSRLFNIAPSQWSRVSECWFITFFFKIGSAVGWTVLTAAFVSHFGIVFLPALFIINAFLIMLSTIVFERFIMRIKREVLMVLMLIFAVVCLIFSFFLYSRSLGAFFALVIFAESVFLAQFNVFIPILVGDRFTPLESQRTFPFIESADTIGGLFGGTIVGLFAAKLSLPWFLVLWMIFLACASAVFLIANLLRPTLPPIPFRVNGTSDSSRTADQIKKVFQGIKRIPFLKGLIVVVLFQWVFMNILEFQYTKAMEQTVTRKREETLVHVNPSFFRASILSTPDGVLHSVNEEMNEPRRSLTVNEQALLAEKLGTWKGIFHGGALIVQSLFASRLITALGVVGSLLLHPVIMLMSLVGMFLKFGFLSSVITRLNFEITNVVHKNAYFASHYALPRDVRDQSAEFLEGMVRPMGTIVGMLILVLLQMFFSGKYLSMWINIGMVAIMAIILVITIRLQDMYTRVSRNQLFSNSPDSEKLNAIEILSQRGHKDAPQILVEKLNEAKSGDGNEESLVIRMKLLSALGGYGNFQTLPEILAALSDPYAEIRLEAAYALMNFHDIGEKFYSQAFSRYRMIETLKDVFRKEKSATVRSAIMRIFSLLHQPDTVPFLLDLLEHGENGTRADCIFTFGLFRDPNAAYYILPYLDDPDPAVRASAVISLWQFPQYRDRLIRSFNDMLSDEDLAVRASGFFVLGEIGYGHHPLLIQVFRSPDSPLYLEAAFALAKCGNLKAFQVLLDHFLSVSEDEFESFRRFMHRLRPQVKKTARNIIMGTAARFLQSLSPVDSSALSRLRRLYLLLGQHDELYIIETLLKKSVTIK